MDQFQAQQGAITLEGGQQFQSVTQPVVMQGLPVQFLQQGQFQTVQGQQPQVSHIYLQTL